MRFALRSTLVIIIPEDMPEEPVMTVMVVARSTAIASIIAGMLAFAHPCAIGTVSFFSAVGFSNIFVTQSRNGILIAVSVTMLVSVVITSSVPIRRVVSKCRDGGAAKTNCAESQDQKSGNLREETFHNSAR
jgi:hypothetical protein